MYQSISKAYRIISAILTVVTLLFIATAFLGCEEKPKKAQVVKVKRTYKGDVEVLNSCGMQGAAAKMRSYLRDNGFDIVSSRNDRLQNYDETVLVLRNPEWEGAKALAQALKTDNVLIVHRDAANILPFEKVGVLDVNNGNRLDTYVIEGPAGSGVICLNGAAARLVQPGDLVIIVAYATMSEAEAKSWKPTVIHVNAKNEIV